MQTRRRWFFVPLVLLAAGCSAASQVPQYDSQAAQETLVRTLDAWKQGRAGALAQGNPPIRFEDDDCRHGLQLTDYRLEQPLDSLRPFDDVQVVLLLRDARGNPVEKTAAYQVVLTPALAVLRSD
jgi:hypothetical protein